MKTIFAVAPNFPSPATSADGQSNYLTRVISVLGSETDVHVQILSIRFGDQAPEESGDGWTVQRVTPPSTLPDIFSLYLPEHLAPAIRVLTRAAVERARILGTGVPVWCHGYETGPTVAALTEHGHHVVAVPHYLVGVETLHDLALGDDDTRREAFDSPWATTLGRLTPEPIRPAVVRWASRAGPWARHGPWPQSIRTQFTKLDMERQMVAKASFLMTVGRSFEQEMHRAYPCTVGRSDHVAAGAPDEIPEATWPWPLQDNVLRVAMVGRPTGQKGWDYAVEALAGMSDPEASRIEIALIGGLGHGNGPYSSYSERVAARFQDLHPHKVANLGPLSHSDTLAHLHGADLLLFPSVFEPFGLVLLEAMKARCAVLASDAAGPFDLVRQPWGMTVPFGVPAERAHGLMLGLRSFLMMERNELTRLQGLAHDATTSYTWSSCARAHLSVLFPG